MKPIGRHLGSNISTAYEPDSLEDTASNSRLIRTTVGQVGSARIEDLIDVAPVSTSDLPDEDLQSLEAIDCREQPQFDASANPNPTSAEVVEDAPPQTPAGPGEVEQLAAMIELFCRVSPHRSMLEAMQCLAKTLKHHLQAAEVYVGVCPEGERTSRLVATSDSQPLDTLAAATRSAESVFQEAAVRGSVSCWPARDANDRHALISHQQFAESRLADQIVSCSLETETGTPVGAIAVLFQHDSSLQQEQPDLPSGANDTGDSPAATAATSFLRAASPVLVCTIQSLNQSTRSVTARLRSGVRRMLTSGRVKTVATVVAVFVGVMLIPMDYRVRCESEIQPVSRRFVAAPFDAPLKNCLVEPGDVVEQGQLLAALDGRELRWELSGITADMGKANKEHNAWLSEQDFGKAAIARHEIERLQNRSAVLNDRTRRLQVRSPIAGIIVAGDHQDSEGVPLETGQSLFEVAPLDQMLIEVAIPEDDIRHVKAGMSISLVLDSMPSETVQATIERIHPRAELRDHENVFIAEAMLTNNRHQLRPGMRGAAKVSTGARALGWNLFHKPVAHVIGWLGW